MGTILMALPTALSPDFLLTAGLYAGIAGVYLLVVPLALLFYVNRRWYVASSVERTLLYGLVFAFFPGMLLFSPFLNFRPQPRQLKA
jgi:NAD(P)H-quinone oxidoreductase subunit L